MSTVADRRFFLCSGQAVIAAQLGKYPDRHVMGELCYRDYKGSKVTVLARWDISVSTKDDMPINPDIDIYLIGDAREIKCRCPGCKNKGRWEMGRAAVKLVIKTYVAE